MNQAYKQLLANQYEAALCTLAHCVAHCPDSHWNAPVAKYPFSQVVFHTLFFTDYYLGEDAESLSHQPFHNENRELFADYEQLKDQEPQAEYTRGQIGKYLDFCRQKAAANVAIETETSLTAEARFPRKNSSRAELHVYNIRHIQHHTAQLNLRLRLDANIDIPWIGSGWRDPTAG